MKIYRIKIYRIQKKEHKNFNLSNLDINRLIKEIIENFESCNKSLNDDEIEKEKLLNKNKIEQDNVDLDEKLNYNMRDSKNMCCT